MSKEKLRGVNLGGWLIVEKWMTPALFSGTNAVDEYTFMQTKDAAKKIEDHRKNFITEADFKWMQENNINAVRLPIGYWVLNGDKPFIKCVAYVDWTMDIAKKYNIKVIIDLHALKGSQNGNDHSGRIGQAYWFKDVQFRKNSIETLKQLAYRYRDYDNLWGLQIINEPKLGFLHITLRKYYKDAYKELSQILRSHTRIIFSDGFTPRLLSGALHKSSHPIAMDVHIYHGTRLSGFIYRRERYIKMLKYLKFTLRMYSNTQPIIIGEWCGVVKQSTFDQLPVSQHNDLVRRHAKAQIDAYSEVAGWFYWNYKTEKPGVWNFKSQVDQGIIDKYQYIND
jgi:glucan 1,3-beta-glucosidase